jgi:hypothetical protein
MISIMKYLMTKSDAPSSSLMDSTTNLKMKTTKRGVRECSLAHNTLGVEGRVGVLKWGLGRLTSNSIIHMDLRKPNNKLVNA